MNRLLQRWMDRSGWQLYVWLWGLLGLMSVIAYGTMLRPEWAERSLLIDEITQQQQNIDNQQLVLEPLPSLLSLRKQISLLLQNEFLSENGLSGEAKKYRFYSSLAHKIGEWIMPFGGQVLRWQRVLEPMEEEAVDEKNSQLLPGPEKPFSFSYTQWNTTLRVNFYGALHLFHQLSLSPSPVLIKIIEINRENHVLTIKLNLKEYLTEGKNE